MALAVGWGVYEGGGCDYYTYAIAAIALSHGQNIYLASPIDYTHIAMQYGIPCWTPGYLYSPLSALIAWPLTLIPLRLGAAIWTIASGIAAVASGLLLGSQADRPWKSELILISTIGFIPIFSAMRLGQAEAFPLFFTAFAIYEWRRNRGFLGGGLLAFGVWFKPMAAALIFLICWRRQWRMLEGAVVVSLLSIGAGIAAFGLEPTLTQFHRSTSSTIPPPDFLQNLLGIIVTFLPALQPQWIILVYSAVGALLVLGTLMILWPPGRRAGDLGLEAGLLIAATTLLFPATEFHHLIMLLLCFAPLIAAWPLPSKRSWKSWGALAVAYALITIQGIYDFNLFGLSKYSPDLRISFSTLLSSTWAQVILWILLAIQLRRHRNRN
ncbi:MAG: glycosyltransferase family 87 protein [Candidatus Bathyarchaeia archaeon]